jgi:hypothetical protein
MLPPGATRVTSEGNRAAEILSPADNSIDGPMLTPFWQPFELNL